MNILLVYPEFPQDTFWSFKYALKFISKKATFPPLGLLTVASLLPPEWSKKLVDMNVEKLTEKDLNWADYVFISAMSLQSSSAEKLIERCKKAGKKTVAGGPLFTAWYNRFDAVDYLVLNEAELTLPMFLKDLEAGTAKHLYTSPEWSDIQTTPKPLWELVDFKKYSSMNIQFSRGCPFNCEFCDIIVLYGQKSRQKTTQQILSELQLLYDCGWRDSIFFVDDNFIGNKSQLKKEVLPAIIQWMNDHDRPFTFCTEASINLADDEDLMRLLVQAGFDMVFIGVESPNEKSLTECNKNQNKNRDLLQSIHTIQQHGLQVQGGFIVGFDSDPGNIFDTLIRFIQQSRIIVAMVGILNAPKGTRLYQRLESENRIVSGFSGDNTDYSINFIPAMPKEELLDGYRRVLNTIYSPKNYYTRIISYLQTRKQNHPPAIPAAKQHITLKSVGAFIKSIFALGIAGRERHYFWKLVFWTLFHDIRAFPTAITFAVFGYHFKKIYKVR